jgi:N-acetylglucosamine-6-phosphate deacetylase
MAAAVRHLVQEVHVSLCQALSMASLIPARMLHASDRKGRLVPGADADVVVLNGNLEVQLTLCRGVVAYATPVFAEALGA